jgi:OmpA-OmpF porin, OOP family
LALALASLAACAPKLSAPRDYTVFFETDRADLTNDARKVVAQIAANARDLDPSKIVVAGRADGGTAHDATLAEERASNVTRALLDAGVTSAKIERQADTPPAERTGVAAHQVIVRLLP